MALNAAVLVLYDAQGRVLLQERTDYKPRWANHWGIFGGGMQENEDPERAVRRELFEELGYTPDAPRLFLEQPIDTWKKFVFIEQHTGSPFTLDLTESKSFGWFSRPELTRLQIIPHDIPVLEKVFDYLVQQSPTH